MKVALLKDPEIRARIESAGFEAQEDAGVREAEARGEPIDSADVGATVPPPLTEPGQ
jgi:penicillin-binding protein 2